MDEEYEELPSVEEQTDLLERVKLEVGLWLDGEQTALKALFRIRNLLDVK